MVYLLVTQWIGGKLFPIKLSDIENLKLIKSRQNSSFDPLNSELNYATWMAYVAFNRNLDRRNLLKTTQILRDPNENFQNQDVKMKMTPNLRGQKQILV